MRFDRKRSRNIEVFTNSVPGGKKRTSRGGFKKFFRHTKTVVSSPFQFEDEKKPPSRSINNGNNFWLRIYYSTQQVFCRVHIQAPLQQWQLQGLQSCNCTPHSRYVGRWTCIDCFKQDYHQALQSRSKYLCSESKVGGNCQGPGDPRFVLCKWCGGMRD